MKEAERGHNILRGPNRGVLQQSRAGTTKSTLLDKSGQPSSSAGGGRARPLPWRVEGGAHKSDLMPLSQSRHRRRTSLSWRRTFFLPPLEGAGRTSAGKVNRSVHDLTSRCVITSARGTRHPEHPWGPKYEHACHPRRPPTHPEPPRRVGEKNQGRCHDER